MMYYNESILLKNIEILSDIMFKTMYYVHNHRENEFFNSQIILIMQQKIRL